MATRSVRGWGSPGVPLLPASLRAIWSAEALPSWVSAELSLPEGSTLGALDAHCLTREPASDRVEGFLAFLLRSRAEEIGGEVAIDRPWPGSLHPKQLGWRVRSCNCFRSARLDQRLRAGQTITFADLFGIRNAGSLTVLDIACTLEVALAEDRPADPPSALLSNRSAGSVSPSVNSNDGDAQGEAESSIEILQALEEPWVDMVSELDPRFADVLSGGSGTVFERIDHLTSNPEASRDAIRRLAQSVREIRARVRAMEVLPIEEVLREYLIALSGVGTSKIDALLARMQWHGAARPTTLEEAGASVGVTRERMRQIQVRVEKRMPPHAVVMPAIDLALSALLEAAPLTAAEASELLVKRGLSLRLFHPASVLAAAVDCGRQPSVQVTELHGSLVVVAVPDRDRLAAVARVAARQVAAAGMGSVLDVVDAVPVVTSDEPEHQVRQLLSSLGGVEFLSNDWFRFKDRTGGLIDTASRKMLAVTSPLDVASLREGLKRALRFRETSHRRGTRLPAAPPREVLSEYYRVHPDFVITTDGLVRPIKPLDVHAELGSTESAVVGVLRASPLGVMHRADIIAACTRQGVNFNTLAIILTYAPFIQHLGASLWMPRGTSVEPAALEALRKEGATRRREKRVVNYGWTSDGRLWIAFQLDGFGADVNLGAPAVVARYIAGRDFSACEADGESCGVVRVYENGLMSGLTRFLRRSEPDEGDTLLVEFDLSEGAAVLAIIDDDALEVRQAMA